VRDPLDAIRLRMPIDHSQHTDLGLANHRSLATLFACSNEQAWCNLACALNTALLLAEQGICAEIEPLVKLGLEALMRIKARANTTGDWQANLSYHHKTSLTTAINAHEEQCRLATKRQIRNALHEVHRRVIAGEVLQ